jgi:prolyl-tRNA synthetase
MYWSRLFIPTLREAPADAEDAAHSLLIRAGYMRGRDFLFLGQRVAAKIATLVRRELTALGAQEFSSLEEWRAIAGELRSYKQLPQIWYAQRDGAMEVRSFDSSMNFADVFRRILAACALDYLASDSEWIVLSDSGDLVVRGNHYVASLSMARGIPQPPAVPDPEGHRSPEEFHTPGLKTIADLSAFTGLPETSQMKSLVMAADGAPVLALVRGDHQLDTGKLSRVTDARTLRPARQEEIRTWFGADAGSLGPVAVKNIRVIADQALRGRRNMICGANRTDYHLRNVTPGVDFQAEFHDVRLVMAGDLSIIDRQPLRFERGMTIADSTEGAPIFVTDAKGQQTRIAARLHRIMMANMLEAAAVQHHDADGLALPSSIAPFAAVITPVNFSDDAQQRAAIELHHAAEFEVLLDDRDERPGVKFKDADLIGVPYRITIGKKLAQGVVEIRDRRARTSQYVSLTEALGFLGQEIK